MEAVYAALECGVCHETLSTAVLLPNCEHNFCSYCIRRWLRERSSCPACLSKVQPTQLRPNRLIDQLVRELKAVTAPPNNEQVQHSPCHRHMDTL